MGYTTAATQIRPGPGARALYLGSREHKRVSCTAEALVDSNGDANNQTVGERIATTTHEDIGPSPTLVTMAGAAPKAAVGGALTATGFAIDLSTDRTLSLERDEIVVRLERRSEPVAVEGALR